MNKSKSKNNSFEQIKKVLEEYDQIEKCAKKMKQSVPDWKIRTTTRGNKSYYYYKRKGDKEAPKGGIYAHKELLPTITKIVKNEYAQKILKEVIKQRAAANRFMSVFSPSKIYEIYSNLSPGRQSLIEPICISDEEYAAKWAGQDFKGKEITNAAYSFYTEKGERVRSKSEKIIADKLFSMGIPYKYEYPIELKGIGKIHPDFLVLNKRERKEYYWEHLGMMDNADYADNAIRRINLYVANGIYPGEGLILSYETSGIPLDIKLLEKMILEYLM